MYDASDIERVRELLRDGWSKAAIAKHLRISRRVIYNWAAAGLLARDLVGPRVRAGSRSKLAAFESVIAQRLSANPGTSTRQLLRELRELGYTGEITQLRTFITARGWAVLERTSSNRADPGGRNGQRQRADEHAT